MYMVEHEMTFNNFKTLVPTQQLKNLIQIIPDLIVNNFSSILWRKDNMTFAQPFCV